MSDDEFKLELTRLGGVWEDIVATYQDKVSDWPRYKMSPAEYVKFLRNEVMLNKQDIIDTFAIVCQIKAHDGRIYDKHRSFLNNRMNGDLLTQLVVSEYIQNGKIYRYIKDLDSIHSTHIGQTIGAMIEQRW